MDEEKVEPTEEELIFGHLKRLNTNSDFVEFREKAIKPELVRLEVKLLDSDKLSEVDLRATLKMYHKLKEMFHTWFETAESYK